MKSPAPIAAHNSTVSGSRLSAEQWADVHLDRAFYDRGLGAGPYLQAPRTLRDEHGVPEDESVERVRPRRRGYVPVKREDGVWCWGRA